MKSLIYAAAGKIKRADDDISISMEMSEAPSISPVSDSPIGLRLKLDRRCDREGCCDRHGVIGPGTGPHKYALRCADCGRHRGWLSTCAANLLSDIRADSSPLPVLRDRGVVP
jgi:hypothetical protein